MGDACRYYYERFTSGDRELLGSSDCVSRDLVSTVQYLKDLSYTRVRILPDEVLARTSIEERIESMLKMMLNSIVPPTMRQCGSVTIGMMYRVHKSCIEPWYSLDQRVEMII